MSRLFIELYLDEDVSVLVATLIRARGFVATTTVDVGQLGRSDEDQLAYSTNQGLAILTHNRADFEELARRYADAGRTHGGILIAVRRSPYDLAQRVLTILNSVTADEMEGQFRYL